MKNAIRRHRGTDPESTIEIDGAVPPAEPSGASPAGDRDRLATQLAIGVIVLGFVLMGGAWFGASGKNFIQQQFPYLLSGGLIGLALVFLGGGILFARDIRREREAMERQMVRLVDVVESALEAVASPNARPSANPAAPSEDLVVVGRSKFHAPDCRLVAGKEKVAWASRTDALDQGLTPCRACSA